MNGRDFVALAMDLGMADDSGERGLAELVARGPSIMALGERVGSAAVLEQEVTLSADEVQDLSIFMIVMQRFSQSAAEIMDEDEKKIEKAKEVIADTRAYLERTRPQPRTPQEYNAPGPLRSMFGDDGKFRG